MSSKTFRAWEVDQVHLLPPSVQDFVSEGHLAHMVRDLVREELDLSAFYARYRPGRGQPPYHPAMMVALLLYAYSRGVYSSRRVERACVERVDFMAVTGMAKPDHDTVCTFRNEHRAALRDLFVQVLQLCRDAGLAKLGHVALDGSKMKANASKHKAMSYKRMQEQEPVLAAEVDKWLKTAQAEDQRESDQGPDDEDPPAHVRERIKQLARIRASKGRVETQAHATAERLAAERTAKEERIGHKLGGSPPKALDGIPKDKAQSNFTDPESRIMKTAGGYEQAFNCQAAVDAESQVIVAQSASNKQNDGDELIPALDRIEADLGTLPQQMSADSGYCSEANLEDLERRGIDGYVATGRQRHGDASPTSPTRLARGVRAGAMRKKLQAGGYESPYRLRKQTVEPVFGQIKEARGFRRFFTRGLDKIRTEWSLLCTTHNLLKLAAARGERSPNRKRRCQIQI